MKFNEENSVINKRYSTDIFISYSHQDFDKISTIIEHIIEELMKYGYSTYYDRYNAPIGHRQGLSIGLSEGLICSNCLIAFISKNYVNSEWCCEEYGEYMKYLYFDSFGKSNSGLPAELRFIPVFIDANNESEIQILYRDFCNNVVKVKKQRFINDLQPLNSFQYVFENKDSLDNLKNYIIKVNNLLYSGLEKLYSQNPKLQRANQIWKFCSKYTKEEEFSEGGKISDINLEKMLGNFEVNLNNIDLENVQKWKETSILIGYEGIARKIRFTKIPFDDTARIMVEEFDFSSGKLHSLARMGFPLQLLIDKCIDSNEIPELQYSYYQYLLDNPKNKLVDATVVGCLVLSIIRWHDFFINKEDIMKYVILPLKNGRDVLENLDYCIY